MSVITVALARSIVNDAQGPDGERHRARLADTLAKLNADGQADALVQLDVELHDPKPVLVRIHELLSK